MAWIGREGIPRQIGRGVNVQRVCHSRSERIDEQAHGTTIRTEHCAQHIHPVRDEIIGWLGRSAGIHAFTEDHGHLVAGAISAHPDQRGRRVVLKHGQGRHPAGDGAIGVADDAGIVTGVGKSDRINGIDSAGRPEDGEAAVQPLVEQRPIARRHDVECGEVIQLHGLIRRLGGIGNHRGRGAGEVPRGIGRQGIARRVGEIVHGDDVTGAGGERGGEQADRLSIRRDDDGQNCYAAGDLVIRRVPRAGGIHLFAEGQRHLVAHAIGAGGEQHRRGEVRDHA